MQVLSAQGVWGVSFELKDHPLGVFSRAAEEGALTELPLPRFFGHRVLCVSSAELAEEIFVAKAKLYGKTTRGYRILRRVLGNGLVTSDGEFWLKQRRTAQPAFHKERIRSLQDRMARISREEIAGWSAAEDLHHACMRLTLRIAADTLLSSDVSGQTERVGAALSEVLEQSIQRTLSLLDVPMFVPTPANLRFKTAKRTLDAIIDGIISERQKGARAEDLLDMLMQARDPETGDGMSTRQLHDEAMTMFLAGHETTANLLAWAFALLARHPEAQTRALADRAFAETVLKETLRLFPPVWVVGREAQQAHDLGGEKIRAGDYVFVSPWALHHRSEYFSSPDSFLPERWLADFKPHKGSYLPFITGPRKCIGDGFALMEAGIVMHDVLSRFSLTADGPLPEAEPLFTLRPKGGVPVRLSPRVRAQVFQETARS